MLLSSVSLKLKSIRYSDMCLWSIWSQNLYIRTSTNFVDCSRPVSCTCVEKAGQTFYYAFQSGVMEMKYIFTERINCVLVICDWTPSKFFFRQSMMLLILQQFHVWYGTILIGHHVALGQNYCQSRFPAFETSKRQLSCCKFWDDADILPPCKITYLKRHLDLLLSKQQTKSIGSNLNVSFSKLH